MTQELLKELFEYREDGHFYRKVAGKGTKVGKIAGGKNDKGYIILRIKDKQYRLHRLIWLYHYGLFPTNQIDHINGIKNDNRIDNLREANNSQNNANKPKRLNCSSKFKGVSWAKREQKWRVRIRINWKEKYLGFYHEESAAAEAYNEAAIKHFGEFALINKI